jgi:hypothetical protein
MSIITRFRFVAPGLVALAVLLAPPGGVLAAKPTFIHDAWDFEFVDPNFCGAGIPVHVHATGSVDVQVRATKKNVYAIFSDHLKSFDTLTGPNGAVITIEANRHGHDSQIVGNGDGTYTDFWTETGRPFVATFPDGSRVADRGRITWEFTYGDNGTPGDPSDDYFISFNRIVDFAGPHPGATTDLCPQAIAAFTA